MPLRCCDRSRYDRRSLVVRRSSATAAPMPALTAKRSTTRIRLARGFLPLRNNSGHRPTGPCPR